MNAATIQLIIALLPYAEKLVIGGVELFMQKDMNKDDLIKALEAVKQSLPEMPPV